MRPLLMLDQILKELHNTRGIDLSAYRRGTLERRLLFRMARLGLTAPGQYLELLQNDVNERNRLIETLTVRVSSFFRNPFVFEYLAQYALPEILERKTTGQRREIRVWSAGCAGGEEPYSLAILLSHLLADQKLEWKIFIIATDINQRVLETAGTGQYPRESLKEVKLGFLDRYFVPRGADFAVSSQIRSMVNFSYDDLVVPDRFAPADSVFGSFDLILCRNVMIYFNLALQTKVQVKITRALTDHGYLVLGDCETLHPDVKGQFTTLDPKSRIYQKNKSLTEAGA